MHIHVCKGNFIMLQLKKNTHTHTHQRWEPQSWWLYYASLLQQANKTSDVTQLNPGGKLDKRPPMANLNPAHTQACTWAMMHMLPTEINKSHPDRTAGMDKVDRGHLEPVKTNTLPLSHSISATLLLLIILFPTLSLSLLHSAFLAALLSFFLFDLFVIH